MKHITILVPEHAVLASIDDPRMIFEGVNSFMLAAGKPAIFKIELVGLSGRVKLHDGRFTVNTDVLLSDIKRTDLIMIPALFGDMESGVEANKDLLPWIRDQYKKGAEVASLCVGAFLLASTGLLKGKKCSTHWHFADQFRGMFPDVELVDHLIVTDEDGVYTSGGASSYWNLLLHLIEKFAGRETAIMTAKFYAIDIGRNTQAPFAIFRGQTRHNDETVKKAQEFIEHNFQEKLAVEHLANMLAISRRSLERRFKDSTSNTINEYIRRVKIEAAKKSLETSRKNVTEVMFDVGYTDTKAFRDVFKKITGMSPIDYRNKYNKAAASV